MFSMLIVLSTDHLLMEKPSYVVSLEMLGFII